MTSNLHPEIGKKVRFNKDGPDPPFKDEGEITGYNNLQVLINGTKTCGYGRYPGEYEVIEEKTAGK